MSDDKTVFMPLQQQVMSPGFGLAQPQSVGNPYHFKMLQNLDYQTGMNQLLRQATEIFVIHYHLLHGHLNHIEELRTHIHDALLKFEMRAQEQHFSKPLIKSAKYVLCAFLDEAVMSQDFGRESNWSQQSLLSRFFNETWGGETVFKIRQFCLENLQDYIELLELIYLVLCLGFKGQFGTFANGDLQLERLQRETYQVIVNVRGDLTHLPLSPHVHSDYDGSVTLKQRYSMWSVLGVGLGVLLLSYVAISVFVSLESVPTYTQVMNLNQSAGLNP